MLSKLMAAVICTGALMGLARADEVKFTRDVVPIFKKSCVMCHLPDNAPAELALHPKGGYANLVGIASTQSSLQRVMPGKPEESYLYHKIVGTHAEVGGSGERMPFGDMRLSEEQVDIVRNWIAGGAKAE